MGRYTQEIKSDSMLKLIISRVLIISNQGICLYEFMCGYVPFAEDADDPYEIYETIIKEDIKFPNYMKDAGAK